MGRSVRFRDFEYSKITGPGNYKIKGFSDDVIKKNLKYLNAQSPLKEDKSEDDQTKEN